MLKNIGIMLIMVDGLGNYAKELPRNFSQPICLIITVAQNYWNKKQCKQKSTDRSSHHLVSVLWLWLFSYDIMPANEREDRLWAAGSPIDSLDSNLIGHYTTQQSLENCRIFPPHHGLFWLSVERCCYVLYHPYGNCQRFQRHFIWITARNRTRSDDRPISISSRALINGIKPRITTVLIGQFAAFAYPLTNGQQRSSQIISVLSIWLDEKQWYHFEERFLANFLWISR